MVFGHRCGGHRRKRRSTCRCISLWPLACPRSSLCPAGCREADLAKGLSQKMPNAPTRAFWKVSLGRIHRQFWATPYMQQLWLGDAKCSPEMLESAQHLVVTLVASTTLTAPSLDGDLVNGHILVKSCTWRLSADSTLKERFFRFELRCSPNNLRPNNPQFRSIPSRFGMSTFLCIHGVWPILNHLLSGDEDTAKMITWFVYEDGLLGPPVR